MTNQLIQRAEQLKENWALSVTDFSRQEHRNFDDYEVKKKFGVVKNWKKWTIEFKVAGDSSLNVEFVVQHVAEGSRTGRFSDIRVMTVENQHCENVRCFEVYQREYAQHIFFNFVQKESEDFFEEVVHQYRIRRSKHSLELQKKWNAQGENVLLK